LQLRFDLLALALELCVPPVSLLVLLLALVSVGVIATATFGAPPLAGWILLAAAGLCAVCAAAVWYKFARHTLPLRALAAVPFYVCRKIPIYLLFLFR